MPATIISGLDNAAYCGFPSSRTVMSRILSYAFKQLSNVSNDHMASEGTTMTKDSLQELYVDELKDLYSAEKQLVKALPKMAKAATSEDLRAGFEEHLEQTKGQVQRLEEIFSMLGKSGSGKKCLGME